MSSAQTRIITEVIKERTQNEEKAIENDFETLYRSKLVLPCDHETCEFLKIPTQQLQKIYIERLKLQRGDPYLRAVWVQQFRFQQKKLKNGKLITKYAINGIPVCRNHLCRLLAMSASDLILSNSRHKLHPKKTGRKPIKDMKIGLIIYFDNLKHRPSHYCSKSKKQFLDYHTIKEMYHDYKEKCVHHVAKIDSFRKHFKNYAKEKNLSVKKLRKDCCNTCVALTASIHKASGKEKETLQSMLAGHHFVAEVESVFQNWLNNFTEEVMGDSVLSGYFFRRDADPSSTCYYPQFVTEQPQYAHFSRHMSVFHNIVGDPCAQTATSFFWDQANGLKGANELIQCFHYEVSQKTLEQRCLIVGIDNCAGNYHNNSFLNYCVFLLITGVFDMFLVHSKVEGHTYFYPDIVAGPFRSTLKKSDIFSPLDIYKIAGTTMSISKHQTLSHCDFFDWQGYLDPHFNHVRVKKKHIFFGSLKTLSEGVICAKKSTSSIIPWTPCSILKQKYDYLEYFQSNPLPQKAYPTRFEVSPLILHDLWKLRAFVPDECHYQFYPEIPPHLSESAEVKRLESILFKEQKLQQDMELKKAAEEGNALEIRAFATGLMHVGTAMTRGDFIAQMQAQANAEEIISVKEFNWVQLDKNSRKELVREVKRLGLKPGNKNKSDLVQILKDYIDLQNVRSKLTPDHQPGNQSVAMDSTQSQPNFLLLQPRNASAANHANHEFFQVFNQWECIQSCDQQTSQGLPSDSHQEIQAGTEDLGTPTTQVNQFNVVLTV